MFSKETDCLKQNIWRQIDCRGPSTIKQINGVQNVRIEIWKHKAVKCFEITRQTQYLQFLLLLFYTKLALNYIKQARCI